MPRKEGDRPTKPDRRGERAIRAWSEVKEDITIDEQTLNDCLLRNEPGRTLTHEEVQRRILAYFHKRLVREVDSETGEISYRWIMPPTKSGLGLSLGVSTKTLERYNKGLRDGEQYSGRGCIVMPEDFPLIQQAYQLIESFHEERLINNSIGSIFWLKASENGGWRDASATEIQLAVNQPENIDRAALMEKYKDSERPEPPDFNNED